MWPFNTTFVSATPNGTTAGTFTTPAVGATGTVNFTVGDTTYEPGDNGSITIVVQVNSGATEITVDNTATASFTDSVSNPYLSTAPESTTLNQPPVPAAPPTYDSTDGFVEDSGPVTVPAPGLLAGSSDSNGDTLQAFEVTDPAGGSVVVNTDGSFTYTPDPNFSGTDTFNYRIFDGFEFSAPVTVTLNVMAVNDPPVAVVDGPYTIAEDEQNGPAGSPNLLTNDTDPDGDALTAERGTGSNGGAAPENGVVAVYPNGTFIFTPTPNYFGPASFTYRAIDPSGATSSFVTINVTVTSVNDVPVANDDSYTTLEDTDVYVDPRSNDTDVENDPLVTTILSGPTNGTLTPDGLGAFDYSPNPNYFGTDSFTYQVSDGTANSNVATVNITVTSVNDVPVAMDDSYVTGEEQTLNVPIEFSVLNNDSDVEDPAGSFLAELTSVPSYGIVVLNPNGTFTYTPQANFSGLDTFTYQVTDSDGASDTATVYIFVGVLNDAPVAQDDVYQVDEDTLLDVTTTGVLLNDSDSDVDDVTTAGLVTNLVNGTLVFNQDGSFTYQPFANFTGTDSFKYQAFDDLVMSNFATVTITVTAANDGPVANDDLCSAMEATMLTIAAPGVLANDFDTEGGPLAASLVSAPTSGSVMLNADGGFVYTPPAAFNGVATFYLQHLRRRTYRHGNGNH